MLIHPERRIYLLRGYYVILDRDLAILYGVSTKALKQAVLRNLERFPADFMFELSREEFTEWRSQSVTSKIPGSRGGDRYAPFAFTEQGIAMLSGVLRSARAVQVNIQIMRSFVDVRRMSLSYDELRLKIDVLERRHDEQFKIIFDAIRRLIEVDEGERPQIGFRD